MYIIRNISKVSLFFVFLVMLLLLIVFQLSPARANPPGDILVITKHLETAYNRNYEWSIEKSVTPDEFTMSAGDIGESEYSVGVVRTVIEDGWTVSGIIGFLNQSEQPIVVSGVDTVILPANISAEITCDFDFPFELPVGVLTECVFSASLPDGSAQTSVTTVTTAGGASYSHSEDFDFSNASVTESGFSSVNVVDTNGEAWAASGSTAWNYNRSFECPSETEFYENGYYTYEVPNTATITETDQSDSANVTVNCYQADIDIRKQEEGPDSRTFPPGSDVPFEIVVTNTGRVNLTDVEVFDELVPDCEQYIGDLAVGEVVTYNCTFENLSQGFTNVAEVVGYYGEFEVSDDDPSTVETDIEHMYVIYMPMVTRFGGCLGERYDIYVGFEDLPIEPEGLNDYDYNDWLVSYDTELMGVCIDDQTVDLEKVTFEITPEARGATLSHQFHMGIPAGTFESDGVATLTIRDQDGNPLSVETTAFDANVDNDFQIFDCTCEPLPPHAEIVNTYEGIPVTPPIKTAFLEIEFNTNFSFEFTDYKTHGEGLFFEPYLRVEFQDSFYDVEIGDIRTLVIPIQHWRYPEEHVRIDKAYPDIVFTDTEWADKWWENYNTCVFGDGIICPDPAYLAYLEAIGR